MAEFLTTSGISHLIENIIKDAKTQLTLVSPYLQLSKTLYERLKDASIKGVRIVIVYGKDDLKPNERNSLAELKNIELYFFQNLHAKCYYNETKMVITSMNMYAFSEKNNREMGVLICNEKDKVLFEKAKEETDSILQSSEKEELKKSTRNVRQKNSMESTDLSSKKSIRGYCIRCESRIDYNPSKPLCPDCYTSWSKYENLEYEENVCHRCGEYETSTMIKPQCYNCYNLSEYEKDISIANNSSNNKSKKGIIPVLHKDFKEPHNFHLPSLTKSLKEMYPKANINLGDCLKMTDFPMKGIDVQVRGRIDFCVHDTRKFNTIKLKTQSILNSKMPEIRFYWNTNEINIYPEKSFTPDISTDGVAIIVNKFIRIIRDTSDVIR